MPRSVLVKDFDRWISGERNRLVRIAQSILKNRDESEDIVQETMVTIWQMYRDHRIKNLGPYARRAVWLNALRHRSRTRYTVSIDEHTLRQAAASTIPDEDCSQSLSPAELEHAISDLPKEQQAVIRLRFYGAMSFREIGSALRISLQTAASRCRYALDALRQTFGIKSKGE
jgi:RNA polymerase sigma-70 factor, ECF subfamily